MTAPAAPPATRPAWARPATGRRRLAQLAVVASAYLASGLAGLALAHENAEVTLVWPPSGIALAALWLGGLGLWPAVALGALLVAGWVAGPALQPLGIAVGNTLAALAGVHLLRAARFEPAFERPRDVVAWIVLAAGLASVVSAAVGATSLCALGGTPWAAWLPIARDWWLGDAAGALVVGPAILAWGAGPRPAGVRPGGIAEATALALVLVLSSVAAWTLWLPGEEAGHDHALAFLPFPALIWAALRFGARGAALAALAVATAAVLSIAASHGGGVEEALLGADLAILWAFLGVMSTTALLTASLAARDWLAGELTRATARLLAAQRIARLAAFEHDVRADTLWTSATLPTLLGLGREDAPTRLEALAARVHAEDRELFRRVVGGREAAATYGPVPCRVVRPDGEVRELELSATVARDLAGEPLRVSGILQDLTEWRRAERLALRTRIAIDNAAEGILTLAEDGRIVGANATAAARLGYRRSELEGAEVGIIAPDLAGDGWAAFRARLRREGRVMEETRHRTRDGRDVPVEVSAAWHREGDEAFCALFARDITERREAAEERERLEEQVRRTQKLESLGVLAGGIAHDFNNLLVPIGGHAELLADDLRDQPAALESLAAIQQATERAAAVCRQLLAYAGGVPMAPRPVALGALVEEMTGLLQISLDKSAVLSVDVAPGLPPVEGDAAQLQQVVLNLVTNASDAVAARGGGAVRVAVRADERTAEDLAATWLRAELPSGTYAVIEVADTGIGMTPETAGRIFDPFFTTKAPGRGLGLAATLGIVRRHRGALDVRTTPGAGTTFAVILPALDGTAAEAPAPREEAAAGPARALRVLVVDDEDAVRAVARRALEARGHTVSEAPHGAAAVAELAAAPDALDAVVLDLTMPGLDGRATAERLTALRPGLPILLATGWDAATEEPAGPWGAVLQKPYRVSELVAALERVAAEGAAGEGR